MKGKAYANRKPESERPENDFYPTPSCMVKALLESGKFPHKADVNILDPWCGKYAIGNVLRQTGYLKEPVAVVVLIILIFSRIWR